MTTIEKSATEQAVEIAASNAKLARAKFIARRAELDALLTAAHDEMVAAEREEKHARAVLRRETK